MSGMLFEDIFHVKDIEKKFQKVSRIYGQSENYEMDLALDINTDIHPVEIDSRFTLVLSSTLNLDGTPDEPYYNPIPKESLADEFEYVMYGKVFQFHEEKGTTKVSVYISYGGLLMMLKGDPKHLQGIELDSRIYLLLRQV